MARPTKSERVPRQMGPKFDAIVTLTDEFCKEYLNDEYGQLARQATAALCRKRPSPLARGRADVWACGIVYALGSTNFIFDKSQELYMSAAEICKGFGVGQSTVSAKSGVIREALDMGPLNLDWCLPSRLDSHPLAWLIEVNGLPVDARDMPREVQEIALEKGYIPYIPGDE